MSIPTVDGPYLNREESFFISGTGDGFSTNREGLIALIEEAKAALIRPCQCKDHSHDGDERCKILISYFDYKFRCYCGIKNNE